VPVPARRVSEVAPVAPIPPAAAGGADAPADGPPPVLPSADPAAPTVPRVQATANLDGSATVVWEGTTATSWTTPQGRATCAGYAVYRKDGSSWGPIVDSAYPPAKVPDAPAGTVLGVAPLYHLPSGELVAGSAASVTVAAGSN
jgi:hypothetical protein